MFNKKFLVGVFCIVFPVMLTACSFMIDKTEPKKETKKEAEMNVELDNSAGINTTDDQKLLQTNVKSNLVSDESQDQVDARGHYAKNSVGFEDIYDYDEVVTLCYNASLEYVRAVRNQDAADFSPYIQNEKLIRYMQYQTENPPVRYAEDSSYKFMVTGVEFYDAYAYVKADTGAIYRHEYIGGVDEGASRDGTFYFLIKNMGGRLYIADWYWDGWPSPDTEYRGEYSQSDNLDYWEDDAKTEQLFEKIGL